MSNEGAGRKKMENLRAVTAVAVIVAAPFTRPAIRRLLLSITPNVLDSTFDFPSLDL